MKSPIRFSFLPSFFTVLAVILAVAIGYRVYSFSGDGTPATASATKDRQPVPSGSTASSSAAAFNDAEPPAPVPATAALSETAHAEKLRGADERRRVLLERALAEPIPSQHSAAVAPAPAAIPAPVRPAASLAVRPAAAAAKSVVVTRQPIARSSGPVLPPGEPPDSPAPKKPTSKDPTSDTSAPTLVAVQFNPPVVHDGEESTVTVIATDDISGVRNVSASISSPSGKALRAFPFQKDPETDQWLGKVQIPRDAEQGIWRLSFLSMSDNANNTANLTFASGGLPPTATLQVISSGSDNTAPTLKSVWLDKRAITEGEHDTLFVSASDDKSGVSLVSGVFISPSKLARIGFGCRPQQQQATGDVWECDVVLPKCVDCGDWHLEQIQMQDKANNQAVFRQNDPNVAEVSFNISGTSCDSTPPVLQTLMVSPSFVSNAQDSVIIITATITDNNCGVQNSSGALAPPPDNKGQAPRVFFPMSPLGDQPNTFQGRAIIPRTSAKGVWSVVWFQVSDKANNTRQYSSGDPVLTNVKFSVQ